ncbi:MAG: serine/threonine-protein kinase [Lentisphaerales bacterium]|nr:serine/threonine-protein kinase [Lentisphaerales bacterium]
MDKSNPSSSQPESTNKPDPGFKFSIKEKLLKELNCTDSTSFDARDTTNFDMVTHIQQSKPREKLIPDDIQVTLKTDNNDILKNSSGSLDKKFSVDISDRYSQSATVGQGGMGVIRSVTDKNLKRTLAMKILSTKFIGDENIANAFIEEARITARLQHPNIIPVHDIGQNSEDNSYFYTMKLVDGQSLQDIIDKLNEGDLDYKKKYNIFTLLNIFRKVCDAVSYAHSKGVIHRDIKPGNVMVGPFGEVLLLDWGLAKYSGKEEGTEKVSIKEQLSETNIDTPLMTMDGIIKGSLAYLSPEQATGEIKEIDNQTDVFLLGATLYHMLTLTAPYTSKNMVEIIYKAENGHFTHPNETEHGSRIPEAIVNLIIKAMSLDKATRFQNVEEMITKLTDYIEARNVSDYRVYNKGDQLISVNDLGEDTFIIISGKVEISRIIDGKSTVVETLESGAVFGELAPLTHSLRSATATAIGKVEVMIISKQLMFDELRKLPPWLEKIVFNLAGKVNSMNDSIHPFLLSNCSLPVLKQLLYLFNLVNTNADHKKTVSIEYLGIIHEISQNLGLSAVRIEEVIDVLIEFKFAIRENNGRLSIANLANLQDLITYIKREQNITEGVDYTAVKIDIQKVPILDNIYQRMAKLRYE